VSFHVAQKDTEFPAEYLGISVTGRRKNAMAGKWVHLAGRLNQLFSEPLGIGFELTTSTSRLGMSDMPHECAMTK
jgi:hypothetical protein